MTIIFMDNGTNTGKNVSTMKILIVSSNAHNTSDIGQMISEKGYGITVCDTPQDAMDRLNQESFDIVFLPIQGDINEKRHTIATIRRASTGYIYINELSKDIAASTEDNAGANNIIDSDNITWDALRDTINNAKRLQELIATIGNNNIDFPSAGGIIARSAFNQLFLSALDRGNRYSEMSSILTISLENYQELFNLGGNYVVEYAVALLSKTLVDIRRQSDIIGQVKNHAFSLLLQMPKTPQEPIEAAKRFADTLANTPSLQEAAPTPMGLRVSLVSIPSGELKYEKLAVPEKKL